MWCIKIESFFIYRLHLYLTTLFWDKNISRLIIHLYSVAWHPFKALTLNLKTYLQTIQPKWIPNDINKTLLQVILKHFNESIRYFTKPPILQYHYPFPLHLPLSVIQPPFTLPIYTQNPSLPVNWASGKEVTPSWPGSRTWHAISSFREPLWFGSLTFKLYRVV